MTDPRAGLEPEPASLAKRAWRVLLVAVAYGVSASVVLGVGRAVANILLLPPLFMTLLAVMVVIGLPLALALAWRYRPPAP